MVSSMNDAKNRLPCSDDNKMRNLIPRIDMVVSKRSGYSDRGYQEIVKPKGSRVSMLLPILLIALAMVLFLIPEVDIIYKAAGSLALIVAAIFVFIYGSKARNNVQMHVDEDPYERELISLMNEIGLRHQNVDSDIHRIMQIRTDLENIDSMNRRCIELKLSCVEAEKDYIGFLSKFGGKNGYDLAIQNTSDMKVIESNIQLLRNNLVISGFDPDRPLPEVQYIDIDTTRQSDISSELGSLDERMKSILDTSELDRLIDTSYTLSSKKGSTLRDSAVLLLSSIIVQNACSDLYEDVHPGVISTADRYLGMMTGDRYRIDTDPRRTDIAVISDEGTKGSKQWSSGLRAQVLLSLKLAIAKEMGNGEIPVILDDVLLPFDSQRKIGACKALAQLSEEMQILMFTCDDAVMHICESLDNTNTIRLD